MPTYAYACKSCGHRFDAVQSFSEPALTECPECGGPLRKEYGSIGVTFNGSGFYRTDSRSAPATEKKQSDAAGGSGGSGGGSGGSGGDKGGSGGSAPAPTSSKSEAKSSPSSAGA